MMQTEECLELVHVFCAGKKDCLVFFFRVRGILQRWFWEGEMEPACGQLDIADCRTSFPMSASPSLSSFSGFSPPGFALLSLNCSRFLFPLFCPALSPSPPPSLSSLFTLSLSRFFPSALFPQASPVSCPEWFCCTGGFKMKIENWFKK